MATVSVRYIVNDVDVAIDFYCSQLGFRQRSCIRPRLSRCSRAAISAWCSARQVTRAVAVRSCPMAPDPNRVGGIGSRSRGVGSGRHGPVLRDAGAHFRNDIVTGIGGRQVLVDDPSGNPVELFEPILPEPCVTDAQPGQAAFAGLWLVSRIVESFPSRTSGCPILGTW